MFKSGLMELEAVVAIARLGSFRAAAVDLDVSPTAIGNAVASLENRLGVRLFNRTTRNVALTSAGREYVEAIAPALLDIRNATQAVADHSSKPTGTLRFSCSLAGGRHLLAPFVFEYLRRYEIVERAGAAGWAAPNRSVCKGSHAARDDGIVARLATVF